MTAVIIVLVVLVVIALAAAGASVRVLREYERAVVFRLGRLMDQRGPGLVLLMPTIDRMVRVSLRTVTLTVPPQETITRDNIPGARHGSRLLPRRRRQQRRHPGRELSQRDAPDRPDDAALGARRRRPRLAAGASAIISTRACST